MVRLGSDTVDPVEEHTANGGLQSQKRGRIRQQVRRPHQQQTRVEIVQHQTDRVVIRRVRNLDASIAIRVAIVRTIHTRKAQPISDPDTQRRDLFGRPVGQLDRLVGAFDKGHAGHDLHHSGDLKLSVFHHCFNEFAVVPDQHRITTGRHFQNSVRSTRRGLKAGRVVHVRTARQPQR